MDHFGRFEVRPDNIVRFDRPERLATQPSASRGSLRFVGGDPIGGRGSVAQSGTLLRGHVGAGNAVSPLAPLCLEHGSRVRPEADAGIRGLTDAGTEQAVRTDRLAARDR
jgi:hypothetical protein